MFRVNTEIENNVIHQLREKEIDMERIMEEKEKLLGSLMEEREKEKYHLEEVKRGGATYGIYRHVTIYTCIAHVLCNP